MRSLLFLLCILLYVVSSLSAKVHMYKGQGDKVLVKTSVGKTLTISFPEDDGLSELLLPQSWDQEAEKAKLVSVQHSTPNLIFVRLLVAGINGRFNVIGMSGRSYTIDVLSVENSREAYDFLEIKIPEVSTYQSANPTKYAALRPLQLLRHMMRGDSDVEGVTSAEYEQDSKSAVRIPEMDGLKFKIIKVYTTQSGLKGFIVHAMNSTNQPKVVRLDYMKMPGLLAVSTGIGNDIHHIVQPKGSYKIMKYGTKSHNVFTDTVPLYIIMEK